MMNTATRITTRTAEIPGTNSSAGMNVWATRNHSSQPQRDRFVGAGRRAAATGMGRGPGAYGGDDIGGLGPR